MKPKPIAENELQIRTSFAEIQILKGTDFHATLAIITFLIIPNAKRERIRDTHNERNFFMINNAFIETTTLFKGSLPIHYEKFLAPKDHLVFPLHWHKNIEIIHMLSGKMKLQLANNIYELGADDICFIDSNISHSGVSLSDDLAYEIIQINKSTTEKYANDFKPVKLLLNNKFSVEQIFKDDYISSLFLRIKTLYGYSDFLNHKHLYIGIICELVAYLTLYHKNNYFMTLDPQFYEITDYIDNHCNEDITVEKLAKRFNFSVNYFSHKFKELVGISPNKYIVISRLNFAENLLINTSLSIEIISQKSGFKNTSYFIRQFKSRYDMTPKAFQQKYKNKT